MPNPTVRVGFLGDASQLAREARRAQASLDGVSAHAHTASTALGTALGTVGGKALVGIAGAARNAVGSIGSAAAATIQAASAMNETVSKNAVVFGDSAAAVKAWANDSSKNIILTKQAAIEASATFGNLFTALGLGQAPAASLSTQMVGLAEDLKSFNDVPVEDALLAIRSGLLGEAEPLRKFGVSLSEARVQAEAYALGLVKPVKNSGAITKANNDVAAAAENLARVQKEHGEGSVAAAQAQDKLTAANDRLARATAGQKTPLTDVQKLQARTSIIMKDTANAHGDLARTQDSFANSSAKLRKQVGDLSVELGAKLLPVALGATQEVSKLITEFEKGEGTGGRLREDLAGIADSARSLGEGLKPVVGLVRWFADHPDALKGVVEGMVLYAAASKSAAIWNTRLAGANAIGGVAAGVGAVAKSAPGAAAGIEGIGAASKVSFPQVVALTGVLLGAVEAYKQLHNFSDNKKMIKDNFQGIADLAALGTLSKSEIEDLLKQNLTDPEHFKLPARPRHDPRTPDDYDVKAGRGKKAVASSIASEAAKAAEAQKAATDKMIGAHKYAADQAAAIAKRKADAAATLQKATDALQEALTSRRQMSEGIRDSLVSSNSILRDGASWTAKDLLSRFQLEQRQVQQFAIGIQALAAKGYDKTVIQQAASAGVGSLGAVTGLAHATAGQVKQINATQAAINKAAGLTGDTATRAVLGPVVNVYIDGKQIAANVITKHAPELATAVNRVNVRRSNNGSRLGV